MGILDTLKKDIREVENKVEETQTPHGQGLTEDQTARCATCSGTGKVS